MSRMNYFNPSCIDNHAVDAFPDSFFENEPLFDERVCRVCGCDDMHACRRADGSPCWWVEEDLCSECLLPQNQVQVYSEAQASAYLRARPRGVRCDEARGVSADHQARD